MSTADARPPIEEVVLQRIEQTNGQEVHVSVYREGDKPWTLSIWLFRRTGSGVLVRDKTHGLRFFRDEWPQVADALARLLDPREKWW